MKKSLMVLFLTFVSLPTWASSAAGRCFNQEVNPLTLKRYQSQAEYEGAKKDWQLETPAAVSPFDLWRAYRVYNAEKDRSLKLGNDKTAHCFIGCRLAMDVNHRTAVYVGWMKEWQDLTDCKSSSRFEPADYTATVRGADLAHSLREPLECARSCQQIY